jgi:hypothetical protein
VLLAIVLFISESPSIKMNPLNIVALLRTDLLEKGLVETAPSNEERLAKDKLFGKSSSSLFQASLELLRFSRTAGKHGKLFVFFGRCYDRPFCG